MESRMKDSEAKLDSLQAAFGSYSADMKQQKEKMEDELQLAFTRHAQGLQEVATVNAQKIEQ
eukprot:4857931-Karenia_brevis.AAC.1